jgi:D-alanine transaminase
MNNICFLNGEFLPIGEAKVSVLDRGFVYGDGIYEYVPVINRKPYRMGPHLARLDRSCKEIGLTNPYTEAEWVQLILELIAKQDFADQAIYWQVTRGVAKRDHAFPKDTKPTVFMMSNPLPVTTPELLLNGVKAYTFEDIRWHRCDIKTISLLGNVLARQFSAERGGAEVVMIRDGFLSEASSSNLFIVKDGRIISPPKDNLILPGITLDAVFELAQRGNLPLDVRPVPEAEIWTADELWLSSSSKGVIAITQLDDKPIADGKPGPVFKKMRALFDADLLAIQSAA